MFEGIAIGVGVTVFSAFAIFITSMLVKLWHTPKRLDRLERIIPPVMRALLAILRCQKRGECNEETDSTIEEIEHLLSEGIVSQKAGT